MLPCITWTPNKQVRSHCKDEWKIETNITLWDKLLPEYKLLGVGEEKCIWEKLDRNGANIIKIHCTSQCYLIIKQHNLLFNKA